MKVIVVPRRICPRCGSKNTATILWGMPAMTQELQDKLDKKEVVLGGCCIAIPSPTHHCNSCGKDFGGNYFIKPTFVKELYFYVGGYFGTSHWVYLHEQKYGKILRYVASDSHYIDIKSELADCNVSSIPVGHKWDEFNKDLLKCYFIDSKSRYINQNVLDGTQWELNITFDNGTRIKRYGSNAYPPHWGKLVATFHKYGLPKIK
mgnify:FL=1